MVAERTAGITLKAAAADALAANLRGELIRPEDGGYEAARRVWNGMIDKRPALIARCADAQDVVHAIAFARTHALPIAVRGGGHSAPGYGTVDGGLVIDLSPLRTVEVDPVARIARAGAGCLLGDLDRATQEHGLAVPAGMVSDTGIAGLTLGGGMGWLSRKHGLTIDNLLAVEIVTADGAILRASEAQHPDLFWAVRGGGGNFGVVTTFEYRLHPVGPTVLAGILLYPFAQAAAVFRAFRDAMDGAPDELAASAVVITAPPHPPFPPALQGQPVVAVAVCYAGDLEEGQRVVRPLREAGEPALDLVGPMPYVALQSMFDAGTPHGLHYWEKSSYVRELTDEALDAYLAAIGEPTSPLSQVLLSRFGGAVGRVPEEATAFAHRDGAYVLFAIAAWAPDDPRGEAHVAWVRGLTAALDPFATGGSYVNAFDEGGIATAYRPATLARLARVKATYDPGNVFRLNQNIAPAS
jgi:FAD/FMN-containing dehydrogenase